MATVEELQTRLVETQDLRATLASDDLPGKHACDVDIDRLRHELQELQADALDDAKAEWAVRAEQADDHREAAPNTAANIVSSFTPGEG